MKRLGEIKVKKHEVQTDEEMKRIVGGGTGENIAKRLLVVVRLKSIFHQQYYQRERVD